MRRACAVLADAPECRHSDPELVGALLHETVTLPCSVDALPAPTALRWSFQEAAAAASAASPLRHQHRVDGVRPGAGIVVTPRTANDYGTYACLAENAVGRQERPCLVRLVHAGQYIQGVAVAAPAAPGERRSSSP